PDSDRVYCTPAVTLFGPRVASTPVAGRPVPLKPPVPVAVSVHAEALAVPPLSLTTCFFNANCGAVSSLVMVQATLSPTARVILLGDTKVPPPVQLQIPVEV